MSGASQVLESVRGSVRESAHDSAIAPTRASRAHARGIVRRPFGALRILGLTSDDLPIAARERLVCAVRTLAPALEKVLPAPPMLVLETCHRIEVCWTGGGRLVEDRVRAQLVAAVPEAAPALRLRRGPRALRHLVRLALGLDSPIPGEREIATQLRHAWLAAMTRGATGPLLDRAVGAALEAAARAGEADATHTTSVAAEAVHQAARLAGDGWTQAHVVVLGAGAVARGLVAAARRQAPGRLTVVARDPVRAARALPSGTSVTAWADRAAAVADADVLLVATGADRPVVGPEDLRASRASLVLDLAMPRNVDPAVDGAHVRLVDVDAIFRLRAADASRLPTRMEARERIARRACARARAREAERAGARALARLHADGAEVAAREAARLLAAHGGAGPSGDALREEVEAMAARVARRLLYRASRALRDVAAAVAG